MIEVSHVKKYFSRPYREKGLKGMAKTLFSPKKIITKAVDDVSFSIQDGQIVGYIGANGAGKSTTIKMMSGILTPSEGHIYFDGLEPYSPKSRREVLNHVGVVFGQRTQLWWDLPLRDSFDLYKDIYEIPKDVYEERFQYLSSVLDLNKFIDAQVRTLSLGQRMRADLAASLIHQPKVLFLDEPTIGLDVLVKERITLAIKKINHDYGTSIILTTHDMKDITNLCERILILDDGHLIYDGTLKDIKSRFGDIRHIYILTGDELDKEATTKAFGDKLSIERLNDGYLEVSYNALEVEAKSLFNYLLTHLEVKDLKVDETSLSAVVKRIYESKSI